MDNYIYAYYQQIKSGEVVVDKIVNERCSKIGRAHV